VSKHQELIESLDQLKDVMGNLVEVAQREQRHLIAFEPEALQACNNERAELLETQEGLEGSIRALMEKARNDLGLESDEAPTLVKLAKQISGKTREIIEERCTCIEALAGTLQELHSMNAFHAERGLKTVRGYLHMLTGSIRERRATTYTPKGRTRSDAEGLATVQSAL
jgi:flagellar biosynthesis/type III secretory pathway chaperone